MASTITAHRSVDEVTITPAMLEAGIRARVLFDREDPAEWIVHAIYEAMELERYGSISPEKADLR